VTMPLTTSGASAPSVVAVAAGGAYGKHILNQAQFHRSGALKRLLKNPRTSRVSYLGQISVKERRNIP
jgi:hypothetical protein